MASRRRADGAQQGAIVNEGEPLSPLQKTQEALRFRATRKTYWDKLDQYVWLCLRCVLVNPLQTPMVGVG